MTRPEAAGATVPAPGRRKRDRVLIGVAALRFVVPLAAVPLVAVLIPEHVVWMLLLRPTKEFQLIGGAQYQLTGAPHPLLLLAAFVPLMVLAVWAYFAVGRMERKALAAGTAPRWLQRALPERQLAVAQAVLARRGATIAVLGRLGGLPPTVLAAAAGASTISARRYLAADTAGALLSFAVMVRAGMSVGRAWEEGVSWLTAVTAVLFLTVLALLARWIRAEARAYDASGTAADAT
ncbi:MAG: DedA family protein [Nitriliruptoraceae bacterium]